MYIRFPLSLRNLEDLLHERGIDMLLFTTTSIWSATSTPAKNSSSIATLLWLSGANSVQHKLWQSWS